MVSTTGRLSGSTIVYSTVVPEESGKRKPGRPRKHSKRQVDPDLKYAQVVKEYDGQGHLVAIKRTMVIGSEAEALRMLNEAGTGKVFNTSYIERDNLTSRTHNGRLVRRSLTFSKAAEPLQWQCQLDDLYYNFCLPHRALRQKLAEPQATKGNGSPKKYLQPHSRYGRRADGSSLDTHGVDVPSRATGKGTVTQEGHYPFFRNSNNANKKGFIKARMPNLFNTGMILHGTR